MSKISTFTIKYSSGSGSVSPSVVIVPDKFVKAKHIPTNQPLNLKFGTHRAQVQIKVNKTKHAVIALPAELARRWNIPNGFRFRAAYQSVDHTLRLGPLIGVIVNRSYDSAERRFGSNTTFYKELAVTCQLHGGMAFFFSQEHIRPKKNTITGWTYVRGWKKMTFPLPDVIYNRISTRKIEQNSIVQDFFSQMNAFQIPVFNEKFLDKHEVFDALQKDASLHPYLPESHLLRNYAMFKKMCTRYPIVFLKPVKGSLGKGIIRIAKLPGGKYASQSMSINGAKTRQFANVTRTFKHFSGQIKSRRYQIQQGLSLLTCKGRPVDFRALVQKNNKGEWSITSIVGRIAGPNHFVSNLARGGSLNSVRDVLVQSKLPPDDIKRVQAKLRTLALRLAEGIDQHIPHHFGELGIDLAVETSGKVWLLEINSKPSKSDNTPLTTPASNRARPSVRKVIQYGAFLSQF